VRQHKDIEGTYYIIKKAFEDDKLKRSLLMPFALALIVYGVFTYYGRSDQGVGAIAALVGLYLMGKMVHLGDTLRGFWNDLTGAISQGKFTVFTSVLAALLVASGGINALAQLQPDRNVLAYTLAFASFMLWWLVGAALIHLAGRVLDQYLREPRDVWGLWMMPFSLVALGLMGSAMLAAFSRAIAGSEFTLTGPEFVSVAAGVVVAFVGKGSHMAIRSALRKRGVELPATAPAPQEQQPAKAP
jgi:putative membrane protein